MSRRGRLEAAKRETSGSGSHSQPAGSCWPVSWGVKCRGSEGELCVGGLRTQHADLHRSRLGLDAVKGAEHGAAKLRGCDDLQQEIRWRARH